MSICCSSPTKLLQLIKPHILLLRTIIYHKLIVFYYGYMMGLGIIQLLVHDWSKFSPSEWFGYLQFNNLATNNQELKDFCFLHHQNRNPHHFEYWITCDRVNGSIKSLQMPICYVTEMVVDWIAANRAYNSSQELLNQSRQLEFLRKNKNNIHPETRKDIRKEIIRLGSVFKQFKMEQEFSHFLENEFQS